MSEPVSEPAGRLPEGPAPASAVIIGTGLIGTSVALALRARGVAVWLADADPAAARLAADIGAGEVLPGGLPPAEPEPRRLAAARREAAIGGSAGSSPGPAPPITPGG